jgi:hypothetical protein
MKKSSKKYPLEHSCFYKLSSKKKLCEILNIDLSTLESISSSNEKHFIESAVKGLHMVRLKNYVKIDEKEIQEIIRIDDKEFAVTTKKERACQTPKGNKNAGLYKIHRRLSFLLSSIQTKEYLFSGTKGKSCLDNAKFHLENCNKFIVKLDLKSFFPSVTSESIVKFFEKDLKCRTSVAIILTRILTFKDRLPTGSPVSMVMAYYANRKMFDEIDRVARDGDCKMSLWVDDIIISGDEAVKVAWEAKKIIINNGLNYHKGKFKIYKPRDNKEITGIIITPKGELKLRNRSHLKIHHLKNKNNKTKEEVVKLNSYLSEARQIEPKISLKNK